MPYYSALVLLLLTIAGLYLFVWGLKQLQDFLLKKRLRSEQLSADDIKILKKIPYYTKLTDEEQQRLSFSMRYFLASKNFIAVRMPLTREVKLVIAFYACFLLLHRQKLGCYQNLKHIIVYAHDILRQEIKNNGGIYAQEQFILEGQSSNDVVVLSWYELKKEAYSLKGENVAVHEFTHEIDFMEGAVDGIPPIALSKYRHWTQTMSKPFLRLNKKVLKNRDWGKYKILGSYAATNEAEFFAVITERYFESPKKFKTHFPDLYALLLDFYKIDPLKLLEAHEVS